MKKVHNGFWDGQPITRDYTAREMLLDAIEEEKVKVMTSKDMLNKDKSPTLNQIVEFCKKIEGEWNGDDSGVMEDRANMARDIIDQINNIKELLKELK